MARTCAWSSAARTATGKPSALRRAHGPWRWVPRCARVAQATCAQRAGAEQEAAQHLARSHASTAAAPADALSERLLALAFVASRTDPPRVGDLLAAVEPLLEGEMPPSDRACLHARWIDQRAYEINKSAARDGEAAAAAEVLYRTIPVENAPSFALCRRANGLAYARWNQGDHEGGAAFAREACRHAGDGGHLRLRAMSLQMRARIVGGREGEESRARALAIVTSLDDEALRLRFTGGALRGF